MEEKREWRKRFESKAINGLKTLPL